MLPNLLLLDREGVLLEHVDPYVLRAKDVHFVPGALAAAAAFCGAGVRLAVVTNQSVIERGLVTERFVDHTNALLIDTARVAGANIEGVWVCPHTPAAGCRCRKPAPGLLKDALEHAGVDPAAAWMVGDHDTDVRAGIAAGCARSIHLLSGRQPHASPYTRHVYADLSAFADGLLGTLPRTEARA